MRARSNDAEAWDRLVTLYAPLVMHWCRRLEVSEADAADIFQEVFRSVAMNLGAFRKERDSDTFRGWLRTITRNKVIDHHRKLKNEPRAVGGSEAHRRFSDLPHEVPKDIEDDDIELRAKDNLVRRALDQIRPHFQEQTWRAFWRCAVDGLSAPDVADELSMSPGAVRVAKSRALQRLRDELGDLIE